MSKTKIFILTLLFTIPVLLFAQMEIIIIDNPSFKTKSRQPVKFSHMNHMEIENVACSDCHHRYENGRNVLDANELNDGNRSILCSHCHSSETDLKKAYHRSCIGCHNSMIKKNKPAGPRLCGECHK